MNVHFPLKVVHHQRPPSVEVLLPLKVVSHERLSPIKGHFKYSWRAERQSGILDLLVSLVVFHQRLPSILGCLPPKLVSHQSPSCIKGRLPLKIVFPLNWYNLISYLARFLLISSPVYSSSNREYYYEYVHVFFHWPPKKKVMQFINIKSFQLIYWIDLF